MESRRNESIRFLLLSYMLAYLLQKRLPPGIMYASHRSPQTETLITHRQPAIGIFVPARSSEQTLTLREDEDHGVSHKTDLMYEQNARSLFENMPSLPLADNSASQPFPHVREQSRVHNRVCLDGVSTTSKSRCREISAFHCEWLGVMTP